MIAHAAARRRADELTAAGDPGQGGDAASLEARQRVRYAPGEPDLGGLQAALASIARETARLLVEDPPGAELRVNELDARAGALRAAIREVSLARAPRDPDWLPDDVRMAERALRESGRGVAADG